ARGSSITAPPRRRGGPGLRPPPLQPPSRVRRRPHRHPSLPPRPPRLLAGKVLPPPFRPPLPGPALYRAADRPVAPQPASGGQARRHLDAQPGGRGLPRQRLDPAAADWRGRPPGPEAPGHPLAPRQALGHQPRPRLRAKKKLRDRLIRLAARHPDWVLGYQDETWWSRLAQPARHAWVGGGPLRLEELTADKADPDPKALACYGL